jgi:hypothetical protein
MRRILLGVSLLTLALAMPTRADCDAKDVQKLVDKVKAGKGFVEGCPFPDGQVQVFSFQVAASLTYQIDVKARLCFVRPGMGVGVTPVPCKNVKEGYPLVAPLITWEL